MRSSPSAEEDREFWVQRVRKCPCCGHEVGGRFGIAQEYWVAGDRHIDLWCGSCHAHVTVVFAALVTMQEPAGDPRLH
ncbi:hypothetical protein [Nocardioides sp. LHG3406-4]|uniref:hypothetical protein n=1 Tax=Nocardioides sp. LHG3406-4 TaxID=2804575 RepID=UPI003CFB8B0C